MQILCIGTYLSMFKFDLNIIFITVINHTALVLIFFFANVFSFSINIFFPTQSFFSLQYSYVKVLVLPFFFFFILFCVHSNSDLYSVFISGYTCSNCSDFNSVIYIFNVIISTWHNWNNFISTSNNWIFRITGYIPWWSTLVRRIYFWYQWLIQFGI